MFNQTAYNKAYLKKYYRKNRVKVLRKLKQHRLLPETIEKRKSYSKEYYSRAHVKERVKNYLKRYIKRSRVVSAMRRNRKKWRESPEGKSWLHNYWRERKRKEPEVAIKFALRRRLLSALKGNRKSNNTLDLVGCSLEELRKHLENQFQKGMNWENYGRKGWHIDHKKPCASFDLTKPEEQKLCFHYSNLQPMWAKENHKKADKVIE